MTTTLSGADGAAAATSWAVRGSYFEACNCDAICPCRVVGGRPGGRSTHGTCCFALSWHIHDGHGHDVDLAGLDVVIVGYYEDDTPGQPWSVAGYLDDRASDDQAAWLEAIFLGRTPGIPGAAFTPVIETVHGVSRARIELDHQPGGWRIRVDDRVRVAASAVVSSDEPIACGIPGLDRHGTETIADVLSVIDPPLSWQLTGRCGFATDFAYAWPPTAE